MDKSDLYIEKLKLTPHPEGGYFREIYRSSESVEKNNLPARYGGNRSFSTSIYFLLKREQKSLLHKLKSDEIWHFYDGSAVRVYAIDNTGKLSEQLLGRDVNKGESFHLVINKEQWFCAEVINKSSFALFGCTVAPGFDFSDFELGNRKNLLQLYPEHEKLIKKFTPR
jgi:predicted cupin superfamily sugar epimerase